MLGKLFRLVHVVMVVVVESSCLRNRIVDHWARNIHLRELSRTAVRDIRVASVTAHRFQGILLDIPEATATLKVAPDLVVVGSGVVWMVIKFSLWERVEGRLSILEHLQPTKHSHGLSVHWVQVLLMLVECISLVMKAMVSLHKSILIDILEAVLRIVERLHLGR